MAGTPSFRRMIQFHPPANSIFSGGQRDVAPLLWKLRPVKRVSSIRASAKSSQGNGDGESRLPETLSSNRTKPLANFAADNFLPIVMKLVLLLKHGRLDSLGCYHLQFLSTFFLLRFFCFMIKGDLPRDVVALKLSMRGLLSRLHVIQASILLLTPLFSKIISMLKLQPQEFITAAGVGVPVPTERLLRSLVHTLGSRFCTWKLSLGFRLLHAVLLAFNALVIPSLSFISGGSKSPFAKKENASALLLVASQKTLPVMVGVVEQLRGALGESGLLVLPCVAAHLNQMIIDSFLVSFWTRKEGEIGNAKVS